MDEPNLYRPPEADLGHLKGADTPVHGSRFAKFAWAFAGTAVLLFVITWSSLRDMGSVVLTAGAVGSLILALPGSLLAMFLPTRRAWIYVPVSMAVSFGIALVIGLLRQG